MVDNMSKEVYSYPDAGSSEVQHMLEGKVVDCERTFIYLKKVKDKVVKREVLGTKAVTAVEAYTNHCLASYLTAEGKPCIECDYTTRRVVSARKMWRNVTLRLPGREFLPGARYICI